MRLLPAMDLDLDTLVRGGVRPFGHALRLACDNAECRSVFAVVTSSMQLLDGTVRGAGSSVLRVEDAGADAPPMAAVAQAGGAFDWLAEEPDLYTDADLPRRAG